MSSNAPEQITIPVSEAVKVSGLFQWPRKAKACYVFGHGAGAGMMHAFMGAAAEALFAQDIATLRYQFPYMEAKSRRPDPPALAQAAVRAAVGAASNLAKAPLIAGGKSFGGRMTSQAQAESALEGVRGLVFFGFPLHPAGKPAVTRAEHLAKVEVPMLFLQGTRDELATLDLLRPVVKKLGKRATLHLIEGADHSFHVPARSERSDAEVLEELAGVVAEWTANVI